MAYRVEELAARTGTSVDTIRYYQARNLLPPPVREGRLAWYDESHVERLARVRRLQARGFGLAVIRRLLDGELDHADEALIAAVAAETDSAGPRPVETPPATPGAVEPDPLLTLGDLAARSGIPFAMLEAVVREGLLVPHRVDGEDRYSQSDVNAAAAGLKLLEHGLPLPELLELARRHTVAMRATAERAVDLFDRYVRQRIRSGGGGGDDGEAERLVSAFEEILPATVTLVTHHFRRTLLAVAQEHIERVGTDGERLLITGATGRAQVAT